MFKFIIIVYLLEHYCFNLQVISIFLYQKFNVNLIFTFAN